MFDKKKQQNKYRYGDDSESLNIFCMLSKKLLLLF